MAKIQGAIFVPSLGETFPTISAAAKATGADPSNIRKVLTGQRQTAGGRYFIVVPEETTAEDLRKIQKDVEQRTTPKKRKQLEKNRKKSAPKVSPEERQRQREKRAAAKRLHGILVGVNAAIRQLEKENVAQFSDAVAELANIKAIIGSNKIGGFDTSMSNLMKLSIENINAAIKAAEIQAKILEKTDAEKLKKRRAAVALQFGISSEELERYDPVLPALWDLLHMARSQQGNNYERSLYEAVVDAVQDNQDPDELRKVLEKIYEEYIKSLQGDTNRSLNDILQDGANMIDKIGQKEEEEEGKEKKKDDEFSDDWLSEFVEIPVNPDDQ